MTLREEQEQEEFQRLSPFAAKAAQSAGRQQPDEPCSMRTCYQRDADRVLHSKTFRRLMHKTQVFLRPEGDHYRTRMTHTLEVARIARTIARGLKLNEDLTEAIALGHDLGHTAFGHAGERILNQLMADGFRHNEQSLRVVDLLEKDGRGLNLSYEVRMGILGHTGNQIPATLEGRIVRLSDRIAYINHDIDDAIRAGVFTNDAIPGEISRVLGSTHKQRIDSLVHNTVQASLAQHRQALASNGAVSADIIMDAEAARAMNDLREFLFEHVYRNPFVKGEESKAQDMIRCLFDHYLAHPEDLSEGYQDNLERDGLERAVCDYIAGMTDNYAVYKYGEYFIPSAWSLRN